MSFHAQTKFEMLLKTYRHMIVDMHKQRNIFFTQIDFARDLHLNCIFCGDLVIPSLPKTQVNHIYSNFI